MDAEEWAALRAQVDNSFWVLRVIGAARLTSLVRLSNATCLCTGYPPLPDNERGFSCGAHKYVCLPPLHLISFRFAERATV
jgi:hypothetical protein